MTPTPQMPEIPTLEKLRKVQSSFSSIMEFLEWAEAEGVIIVPGNPTKHVYRFFEIDEKQVEKERVALLDYQRGLNAQGQAIP